MKFLGTVEVAEKDAEAHRALLRVKSKEEGGQGHANADVVFQLNDGGGEIHTRAQITGKAASMGEGVVVGVLDALISDFTASSATSRRMAIVRMREIREGEIPFAAGTAVQEDPDRPAFRGNGPDDYVCVKCGNVLAESMHAMQMTKKVRVRCGRCSTVNVAVTEDS